MTLHESTIQPLASGTAPTATRAASGWLAALGTGAGLAALMASSCCIVPLGLAALGAGAGVFSGLEWLATWRVPLLAASALATAAAWILRSRKSSRSYACHAACARPDRSHATLFLLIGATIMLAAAASWTTLEPLLLETGWLG